MLFSKADLRRMIVPLIIEQILSVMVGMADTIMISGSGEAAVSAVSLVNTINILLINVFAAVATGGAVVAGQYLGEKKKDKAGYAGEQLILFSIISSTSLMIIVLIFRIGLMNLLFGNIEDQVMYYSEQYLVITGISIPFLALYNSCAALFRGMGNAKTTMKISAFMNIGNIIGNAIFIYGFHMSVSGAALSSLISRFFASIVIYQLLKNPARDIHIAKKMKLHLDKTMIKKILHIGVPNGMENSMFQIGKILVLGLVTSFGTIPLAANAVCNTIAMFQVMPGMAIGLAILAVVAQCVGANEYEQAHYYTVLLIKTTYKWLIIINVMAFILCPYILQIYQLSDETTRLSILLLRYHAVCTIIIWPLSFSIPYALRAANDVIVTMSIAIFSMWVFRIAFSYLLGKYFGLGVFGIWVAMTIDWFFRGVLFSIRYIRSGWKRQKCY